MNNDRFKFRIWYNGDYTLTPFCILDNNGNVWFCDSENDEDIESWNGINITDKCILELSTGLRDKNGNLIYEGDIIHDLGEIEPVCNLPLVVKWSDRLCGFVFDNEKIGMRTHLNSIDSAESHNYEIIGNIHKTKGGDND